jgi:hypothetical protein
MPAPSQLAIATSSLQRLAKEEASYHKELQMQQKSIDRLEKSQIEETDEDRGNHAFQLKQEVRAQMTEFLPILLTSLSTYCVLNRMSVANILCSGKPWKKPRPSFPVCTNASQVPRRICRVYWQVYLRVLRATNSY